MSLRPHLPLNIISFLTFEAAPSGVTRVFSVYIAIVHLIKVEPYVFLNMLPSATPLHILDGFPSSFSEMPNRALAFGRSCAAGKGGASRALATFFTIFSVVSTAVLLPIVRGKRGERGGGGGGEKERNL